MARVRLQFSKLDDARFARKLVHEEPARPETRQVLLARFTDDVLLVTLPSDHPTLLTTYVLDQDGEAFPQPSEYVFYPSTVDVARDAPKLSVAAPVVLDSPTPGTAVVLIEPAKPTVAPVAGALSVPSPTASPTLPGAADAKIEVEVRVGLGTPADATATTLVERMQIPAAQIDEPVRVTVPVVPGQTTQTVYVRKRDPVSGREGAWQSAQFKPANPAEFVQIADFTNSWGSGVIESHYGLASMLNDAGSLRVAIAPSMFADAAGGGFDQSVFGMSAADAISFWSMQDRYPWGRFEAPEVDQVAIHDFYPHVAPEVNVFNRMTERSVFSEDYAMFRDHERVLRQRAAAGVGFLRDEAEDISMFGDVSDGSPLTVVQEIKQDQGAGYGAYEPVKHGRRMACQKMKARLTMFSHRGLRSPSLLKWHVSRWRQNRKWEFLIPINVANGDKTYTFSPVPDFLSAGGIKVATVTILGTTAQNVSYQVKIASLTATQIRLIIQQTEVHQVVTIGGVVALVYTIGFGAVPKVTCSAYDPAHAAFTGTDFPAAGGCTIFATTHAGAAADEDVDVHAMGPPPTDTVTAHVVLTGY
jgi:hypothetical protein